jgi:LysM repeat protein
MNRTGKILRGAGLLLVIMALAVMLVPVASAQSGGLGEIVDNVNAERAARGLPPVSWDGALAAAAQDQSNDMADGQYVGHTGMDGSSFFDRAARYGYVMNAGAENVVVRPDQSSYEAFQQWMNSAPHMENIVNGVYQDVGIGVKEENGYYYFTMVLGRPIDGLPLANDDTLQYPPPELAPDGYPEGPATPPPTSLPFWPGDARLNVNPGAPVTVYCNERGGVSVLIIDQNTSEGIPVIEVGPTDVGTALAQATSTGQHVKIAEAGAVSLWALWTYELQVHAPVTTDPGVIYDYIFDADTCGTPLAVAPAPTPVPPPPEPVPGASVPPASGVASAAPGVHIVQPGENLYRIGLRYGVSYMDLATANGISNPNTIYAGQQLIIPTNAIYGKRRAPQAAAESGMSAVRGRALTTRTHVVEPGENLFRIALRYGTTVAQIAAVNDLASAGQVFAGQSLVIPN